MPITQDRMLLIIRAGLSFHAALELVQHIVSEQCKSAKQQLEIGNASAPMKILSDLEILLQPQVLVDEAGQMPYHEAWHQLTIEAKHFHDFKGANVRNARYQRNKRAKRKQEIEQATSAWQSNRRASTVNEAIKSAYQLGQEQADAEAAQAYERMQIRNLQLQNQSHGEALNLAELITKANAQAEQETQFISEYRALTTTGPTRQEITKYLSDPTNYKWPKAPGASAPSVEIDFANYEPDDFGA